jgi:nucleoside phosphorylase/CheY-like chemotaxis protein/tRNA A-37 threonylcarbamoyl transferase component Bud32
LSDFAIDVLLVTAVDVELTTVTSRLKPFADATPTPSKLALGANTYHFGKLGRYRCAAMMTEMGSGGTGGSALAVSDAIQALNPTVVVMVGIAFGRDSSTQRLGDLLVAKHVIPYELQRIGAKVVPRAAHVEAGTTLLNRARNLGWVYKASDGEIRKPIFGPLLSGEKLLDSLDAKQRLFELFPHAIGGEMEAAGVAAACQRLKREWLVAKSICDWGDGEKTDNFQERAAAIATDFLEALLHEDGLLSCATEPGPKRDDYRSELRTDLGSAYEERERLIALAHDTTDLDKFILDLKRRFREGGQLHEGDFLGNGRYRLIAEVGTGGFATVWRAFDRIERKIVAVKVLHAQYARDETRRERFFRGAKKMSELRDRSVVAVFAPHEEDAGWYFFVMEYLALGDLGRAVSAGLDSSRALHVVLTAAEGLQAAHDAGMVHRDVCPPNILMRDDGTGVVTDFDLVRAFDTTGGTRTAAMGRYVYAAPETMGDAADAEPAADVYGLGMSALCAVLGREVPNEVVRDQRKVLNEAACSIPVRRVIERAIAWAPADRFATVREFAEALSAALSLPRALHYRPVSLEYRRVLVVDDEKFIRDILADFINMEGAKTFVAASPAAALELLTQHQIDVVLVDLNFAARSATSSTAAGLELLKKICQMRNGPRCIVISGFATPENTIEAMKIGAVDYVLKPFKVEDIINRLVLACDR